MSESKAPGLISRSGVSEGSLAGACASKAPVRTTGFGSSGASIFSGGASGTRSTTGSGRGGAGTASRVSGRLGAGGGGGGKRSTASLGAMRGDSFTCRSALGSRGASAARGR